MQARTALVAAIITGGLAVAIVAADVAWSLEATLEGRTEDGWTLLDKRPMDDTYRDQPRGLGCAGPEMRVIVDNHRPIGADTQVLITYDNQTAGRQQTLVDERLSLDAFESETYTFTIPPEAFAERDAGAPDKFLQQVSIQVQVGRDIWLSGTACKEDTT